MHRNIFLRCCTSGIHSDRRYFLEYKHKHDTHAKNTQIHTTHVYTHTCLFNCRLDAAPRGKKHPMADAARLRLLTLQWNISQGPEGGAL